MPRSPRLDRCLSSDPCPAIYGPIDHPVFGRCLGVNLGAAARKSCSWACRYCQPILPGGARAGAPPSRASLVGGLQAMLRSTAGVGAVVLAGNGEPTLHAEFPSLVADLLALREKGGFRLLCITNGSRLGEPGVAEACNALDETWVKLDCAEEGLFRALNLGDSGKGSVRDHLRRIARLSSPRISTFLWRNREFSGQNWQADNLRELVAAYRELRPAGILLSTLSVDAVNPTFSPVPWEDLSAFALRVEELGVRVEVV